MVHLGDIIVMFFSVPTPYVLRPRVDGRFDFVGECSLRELKVNNAVAMLQEGVIEEEIYELV